MKTAFLLQALLVLLIGLLSCLGAAAQTPSDEATKLVTRSALGAWMLREDPGNPRLNCGLRFIPSSAHQPGLAIFGPTGKSAAAAIVFSSAAMPWTQHTQDVVVELQQRGLNATRLKTKLMAREKGTPEGQLLLPVGDIKQTLASMRDSERSLALKLDGATVFELEYDGLELARSAMLECLEGRTYAGRSLRDATADIRPLGSSTIKGQVYYKGAALARKQYPPKGSPAVGLIWMTEEFKAWYEHVKATKKLPSGPIPERILKHFMSTRIVDDQGRFVFTNLPAGEFMLVANFSYEKTVSEREYTGQTQVVVQGQVVASSDNYRQWYYTVQQPTSVAKNVTVPADGQTVTVSLDKSQFFCFLVCF